MKEKPNSLWSVDVVVNIRIDVVKFEITDVFMLAKELQTSVVRFYLALLVLCIETRVIRRNKRLQHFQPATMHMWTRRASSSLALCSW